MLRKPTMEVEVQAAWAIISREHYRKQEINVPPPPPNPTEIRDYCRMCILALLWEFLEELALPNEPNRRL